MNIRIRLVLLIVFLSGALGATAWADTKSATFQVSCTVRPMIELSAPAFSNVAATSNLATKYQMSEDLRQTPTGQIQLYSLTAL